ncbi:MAG TPA: transposase domain-containing protein [Bacteroidales bacterium]|nr:transposase domain-containing protein [Bacteroidales bacterium]MCZ2417475.1 transposase domain-containing protein [Burkholderiales bacterium]MCZ2317320.1 transposase domain-containing protein [Bacteroidales bacterium]NLZ08104.1 IS66 family transposase [Bacteroidales bacterium]HNR28680.1 transposase domain-containing protein [Bacteroidales bacterium]
MDNLIENAIRPLVLGRKKYLFCGNGDAAVRASMVYSLLGSCKAAGVNPEQWLEDVLSKIYLYSTGKGNMEDLLPANWAKSNSVNYLSGAVRVAAVLFAG